MLKVQYTFAQAPSNSHRDVHPHGNPEGIRGNIKGYQDRAALGTLRHSKISVLDPNNCISFWRFSRGLLEATIPRIN